MTRLQNGSKAFVSRWKENKQKWAVDYSLTWEYFYRQIYHLPRNDPRYVNLTPEELELECLAWLEFNGIGEGKEQRWAKEAQERLKEIISKEEAKRRQNEEFEEVNPEEVFNVGK